MKKLFALGLALFAVGAVAEETFTHGTLYCTNASSTAFELVLSGRQWTIRPGSDEGTLVVQGGSDVKHARNQDVYSIDGWGDGDTDFYFLIAPSGLSPSKSANVILLEKSDENKSSRLTYECHPLQ
jgi:hypothetical protein